MSAGAGTVEVQGPGAADAKPSGHVGKVVSVLAGEVRFTVPAFSKDRVYGPAPYVAPHGIPAPGDGCTVVFTDGKPLAVVPGSGAAHTGVVDLEDYPALAIETDATGRFARALAYGFATYPLGFILDVPYGILYVASLPSMQGKKCIRFRGRGGRERGGIAATNIIYTGTADRFVDFRSAPGCETEGIFFQHTDPGFTGTLVDWRAPVGQANVYGGARDCTFGGTQGIGGTASELVALANCHSFVFDKCSFSFAVCAIRGRDTDADFCNSITLRDVYTGNTNEAPIQDLAGEGCVAIDPVGEPLNNTVTAITANTTSASATLTAVSSFANTAKGTSLSGPGIPAGASVVSVNTGASTLVMSAPATATATGAALTATSGWAGWYKTTLTGSRGFSVFGGWFGDSARLGEWVNYTGSGFNMLGGEMSQAGTAIKFGANSGGCTVHGVVFDENALVFDVGANCNGMDLYPNSFATSNTALIALGGAIYGSKIPRSTSLISIYGDPRLAGTWFGDQFELDGYLAAYRTTANQVILGRTASGVVGPGVAFGASLDVNAYKSGSALKTDNAFQAASYAVGTTALASTHLSDTAALARLASPTLTGDPKAPTPAAGDNDTSIATTAHVKAQTGTWTAFPFNTTNWGTAPDLQHACEYRVNANGDVQFRGEAISTGGTAITLGLPGTGIAIGTLPSGARPTVLARLSGVRAYDSGGGGIGITLVTVAIATTGVMTIENDETGRAPVRNPIALSFDGKWFSTLA